MKKLSAQNKLWILIALLAAATLGIVLFISLAEPPKEEVTTYSMGSYVQQTVYGQAATAAVAEAANAVAELEDKISWRKPDSDVFCLNTDAGGNWQKVDISVLNILESILPVAEKSGGAFDPTIAPLSLLWDFDNAPTAPPEDELIRSHLEKVDYKVIKTDAETQSVLLQKQGFALDLGAVGKGAACDAAVSVYEKLGAEAAIIAVGGSVGLYGTKSGGAPWSIAVKNPEAEGAIGSLSLDKGFISTSGSYEKYFEYEGKRYFHLLDPKTGYPAKSGLSSVTVVAENGAVSDALSTACFVLGLEKSLPLLEEFSAEALFIDENHHITLTEGLKGKFSLTAEGYTADE